MNAPIQAEELSNWSMCSEFNSVPEIILQAGKNWLSKMNWFEIRFFYLMKSMQQK